MERKSRQPVHLHGKLHESKAHDPDAITPRERVEMFSGASLFTVGAVVAFVVIGHPPSSMIMVTPWLTAGVCLFGLGHFRRLK